MFDTMLLWLLASAITVRAATVDSYRAAVLEHVRFPGEGTPAEIFRHNLRAYKSAAETAAQNGADIIVFPEWGLHNHDKAQDRSALMHLGERVPAPKSDEDGRNFNPCGQEELFQDRPVLRELSCMARQYKIFLVANMVDIQKCNQACDDSTTTAVCPDDGVCFYNANVVFDPEGFLIARYRKRHLYFEPHFSHTPPSDDPDAGIFETDFGTFATFVCFDLSFRKPVDVVRMRADVRNVAYPTHWFDHMPFAFAPEFQQAWAYTNQVNLLAANVHRPGMGTLGSGIYSASRGALVYTHHPNGLAKLLISNVPKDPTASNSSSIPLNIQRFVIDSVNDKSIEVSGDCSGGSECFDKEKRATISVNENVPENDYCSSPSDTPDVEFDEHTNEKTVKGVCKSIPVHGNECSFTILGPAKELMKDYRCAPANTSDYEFVKLVGDEGKMNLCSKALCCSLAYEAESMQEDYYFGVSGTMFPFYDAFEFGVETCLLARCSDSKCSTYPLQSKTVFRRVEMSGRFSTKYVYPSVLESDLRLAPVDQWSYDVQNERITYRHSVIGGVNTSLRFLGLYGRRYNADEIKLN